MSYPYLFNTLNIGADLPFSAVATELAEAVVAGDVVVQARREPVKPPWCRRLWPMPTQGESLSQHPVG